MSAASDMSVRSCPALPNQEPVIYSQINHPTETPSLVTSFTNSSQITVTGARGAQRFHPYNLSLSKAQNDTGSGDDSHLPLKSSTPRKSHARKKDEGHITRPPNSFLCFRKFYSPLVKETLNVTREQDISKIVGVAWKNLLDEDKAPFVLQAQEKFAEHMLAFPDYAYRPKKKDNPFKDTKPSKAKTSRARTGRARSAASAASTPRASPEGIFSALFSQSSPGPQTYHPPSPSFTLASSFSGLSLEHTAAIPHPLPAVFVPQQLAMTSYVPDQQLSAMYSSDSFGNTLDQVCDAGQYGLKSSQSEDMVLPPFVDNSGYTLGSTSTDSLYGENTGDYYNGHNFNLGYQIAAGSYDQSYSQTLLADSFVDFSLFEAEQEAY